MGHAIGPSTTVAYMNREHMRQKKDVVCGLLFLLHDSADLGWMNPNRNPIQVLLPQICTCSYLCYCSKNWNHNKKRVKIHLRFILAMMPKRRRKFRQRCLDASLQNSYYSRARCCVYGIACRSNLPQFPLPRGLSWPEKNSRTGTKHLWWVCFFFEKKCGRSVM